MFFSRFKHCRPGILLTGLLFIVTVLPATAANLNDLLGKKELDESERKETIERIENIQEKLKLLQEKLRVLERRKAEKEAVQRTENAAAGIPSRPVQINWLPIDETTANPGEFGLYTYLLFKGDISNSAAVGSLEDFILTIETLPENDIPPGLANRFLVPVEKPQSMVNLGRQPYDFKLNGVFLRRLNLQGDLPDGPLLVSTREPLDPFGSGAVPAYLAVSFGQQPPQRALELAKIWQSQEKDSLVIEEPAVAGLFWAVLDGAGPTRVERTEQRILIALPQQ